MQFLSVTYIGVYSNQQTSEFNKFDVDILLWSAAEQITLQ